MKAKAIPKNKQKNDDKIRILTEVSGHASEDVINDLPVLSRMRRDKIWAINKFFCHGDPWLHSPLAPFQARGIKMLESGKEKCTIIWPRGHAKTTIISRAYATLLSGLGAEQYVIIYSLTEEGWEGNLEAARMVLNSPMFARLQWLFEYVHGKKLAEIVGNCVFWGNGAITEFKSLLGESRGKNRPEAGGRPSLIILDDIIPTEAIDSPTMRRKIETRYLSMIRPMGRQGCRIWITGTVVHIQDLIGLCMTGKLKGFEVTPLADRRAYEETTQRVLWPERHSFSGLMKIRDDEYVSTGNVRLWKREFLNDPSEEETHPFVEYAAKLPTYDPATLRTFLPAVDITLAIDNAHGAGGDNFVCLEYWRLPSDDRYIRDAAISNTIKMADRLNEVLRFAIRQRAHRIVIQKTAESIDFIEVVEQFLRQHKIWTKVIAAPVSTQSGAKNARIYDWLQPPFDDDRIRVPANKPKWVKHLEMEMGAFDRTSKNNVDDCLDTLALAEEHSGAPSVMIPVIKTGNPTIDTVVKELVEEQARAGKRGRKSAYIPRGWL